MSTRGNRTVDESAFTKRVGENLRVQRLLAGKTQAELAEAVEMHRLKIVRAEAGKLLLTAFELHKIQCVLTCYADDLVEDPTLWSREFKHLRWQMRKVVVGAMRFPEIHPFLADSLKNIGDFADLYAARTDGVESVNVVTDKRIGKGWKNKFTEKG